MRSSYSRILVVAAAVLMLTGCASPGGGNYNRLSARNWWPWGKEKQAEALASQPLPQRPSASATPGGTALSGGNSSYSTVSRGAPTSYPTTSTPYASEGYAGDAAGYGAQPASYGAASYGAGSHAAAPPASGYEATGAYGAGSGTGGSAGYRTASQSGAAGYGAGANSGRYESGAAAGSSPYESEPVDYSRYESRPSSTGRAPAERSQPSAGYSSGSASGGYEAPASGGSYTSSSNYTGDTGYEPGNTGYDAGNTGYAPEGVSPYESPAPAYDAYNSRSAAPSGAGASGGAASAAPSRAATGTSTGTTTGQYRPGGTRDYSAASGAGGGYGASAGEATPEMLTPPPASARGYGAPSGGYNSNYR